MLTKRLSVEASEDAKLDVTELKHFFHRANLHSENPALFKIINDIAVNSEFKEQWTLDETIAFFMKHPYLDSKKELSERPVPTLDQMVSLFEALDSNKNGFLPSEDMRNFIENIDKHKQCNFDLDKYIALISSEDEQEQEKALAGAQQKTEAQLALEEDINKLIHEFDLNGDEAISPEEFFNIIMTLYDK